MLRSTMGRVLLLPFLALMAACTTTAGPSPQADDLTPVSACPALETATTPGPGTVRDGVVAVRICGDDGGTPYNSPPLRSIAAPVDPLTTRVGELVELVNGLPVDDREELVCPASGGVSFLLAFQYPDGGVRYSRATLGGCGFVEVGDGSPRVGADQVLTSFMRLLQEQRAELSKPAITVDLACPPGRSDSPPPPQTPLVGPGGMTRAVVCAREHGRNKRYRPAQPMTPDEVVVIARDLRRPGAPIETFPADCAEFFDTLILAQNTWGDVVALNPVCDHYIGPGGDTGGSAVWQQSPRSQRLLDQLVADALAG